MGSAVFAEPAASPVCHRVHGHTVPIFIRPFSRVLLHSKLDMQSYVSEGVPRSSQGAAGRAPGGGAGEHHHHPRDATPGKPGDCPLAGEPGASRRRGAGHHCRNGRRHLRRPLRYRTGMAGHRQERPQAEPQRSTLRAGHEKDRRHHGGRHHDLRAPGGHQGVRHRRDRRRPSRSGREFRHLGGPRGAGAHAGRGGLRRRQGAARSAQDAGVPGDARRAGDRLRHRRVSRVLEPAQRPARRPCGWTLPPKWRVSSK